jgi:hypothetical protein
MEFKLGKGITKEGVVGPGGSYKLRASFSFLDTFKI